MLLPPQFKQAISSTFYDKTITKLVTTETNTDGWIETNTTEGTTFQGNVRFSNLGELQSELGLVETIDIAITCDPTEAVAVHDRLQYGGQEYEAISVLPFDSHMLITGKKWQLS